MTRLPDEILSPQRYSEPQIQMGPFLSGHLDRNLELARQHAGREPDWTAATGRSEAAFLPTRNGRTALGLALRDLALPPDAGVAIVTTSGSPYVSSCVTDEIARVCRWTREPDPDVAAVVLIHEFGFPARLPDWVEERALPVVEDCAYAFGTQDDAGTVGRVGHYVVYSWSKAFPLQFGGLLVSPRPIAAPAGLSAAGRPHLLACLSHYLARRQEDFARRRAVWTELRDRLSAQGFAPRFESGSLVVPHAFVVAVDDEPRAVRAKPLLQAAGIVSSVFYGGGGYYLPCHPSMGEGTVAYVAESFARAWAAAA